MPSRLCFNTTEQSHQRFDHSPIAPPFRYAASNIDRGIWRGLPGLISWHRDAIVKN
ncbi:MAG: hypothetical protein JWM11_5318 [Planctomycetaceae bacterium]|nr:hypothetical protein [Planctomycetaceae bacterium]